MVTELARRLRECREQAGLSQKELAERAGVSRGTCVNWESGRCEPGASQLFRLCECLGIDPARLIGADGHAGLRADERRLLTWYGRLTERGRGMALGAVRAMAEAELRARDEAALARFTRLPFMATPAAAGTGCDFNDLEPSRRYVRAYPGADAVITVRGESMEPVYHDGDMVYVRFASSAEPGENAVCATADGAVIKRVTSERRLCSLNPDTPFGERFEDDNVRVLAVALARVEKDDLPDADEAEILRAYE